jgi:hypothetical protein
MLTILAAIDARRIAADASAAFHGDRQVLGLFLFAANPQQQGSNGQQDQTQTGAGSHTTSWWKFIRMITFLP